MSSRVGLIVGVGVGVGVVVGRAAARIAGLSGRWPALCAGLLLSISQQAAWADVWGYMDDLGTAHFAAEKVDERYSLFFQAGQSFDTRDMAAAAAPAGTGLAQMRTFFDISPGYKAVRRHLRAAADLRKIDYALLQALIVTESGFDAGAVSPRGAVGLMQVMPATARQYGIAALPHQSVVRQLVDPLVNIGAGTRHLRYLLDLFPGRLELAIAAYNAGEGAVQRAGGKVPDFPETQNYVKTVMQIYRLLRPTAEASSTRAVGELPGRGGAPADGGGPHRVRMELAPPPAERMPVSAEPRAAAGFDVAAVSGATGAPGGRRRYLAAADAFAGNASYSLTAPGE
ncbi:lytic transglycosylase domain-containing protein [Xylophilus ampelinus]|uniref:Transglycosylase-like protein with SLT domain n=1 Tax=Xylophilus ampelinus TaxID=54067 RepID=A0A318SKN8_9BURK|nr:lytic transglycosylase domain-containing protein [Xylophilus ampelinus]MCS4509250.1 lytic transglycosylase domain-containing protein [Xylophilus ampelinus]PYE79724.1 transglycosylase-like protein with SLT domain [Xylophilus ampelinus]